MASLEKRTSDGSDDHIGKTVHTAAYSLDERRRAALAEVDNAKFSYVTLAPHPTLLHLGLQVVPFQSLHGSRRGFLHRRVSPPLSVPKPA